jgi:hypothetical protein
MHGLPAPQQPEHYEKGKGFVNLRNRKNPRRLAVEDQKVIVGALEQEIEIWRMLDLLELSGGSLFAISSGVGIKTLWVERSKKGRFPRNSVTRRDFPMPAGPINKSGLSSSYHSWRHRNANSADLMLRINVDGSYPYSLPRKIRA